MSPAAPGGPGAPAYAYVAERHLEEVRQPLTGWFGHRAPFAFSDDYEAAPGIEKLLCGTPPILGLAALEVGVELIAEIGVERRVHTAGGRKAILDPFRPENPDDIDQLKEIQEDIHEQFIDFVRARRGERLDASDDVLFSGEFWTGKRALALGLIDGIGDLRGVMRAKFGDKVRLRVVGSRRGWLERRFGLNLVDALLDGVEARAVWWRFGL